MSDDLQEEVQQFTNLSRVINTDKNTEKWLRHIERYRRERNVDKRLEEIDNKEELDTYLSLFIAWLERKDGTPFKVESLYNCYAALARFLRESIAIPGGIRIWDRYSFPKTLRCLNGKMRSLQDVGFGNTDQSSPLTSDEIFSCLKHDFLSIDNNQGLIRQVFFWLSLLCGLCGGDTYNLQYRDIERHKDSGLQLCFRKEKNNQGGIFYRQRYGHMATRTENLKLRFDIFTIKASRTIILKY